MKETTASSIRLLARQLPSVLDKNVERVIEGIKERITLDNRHTDCLFSMVGTSLEDTQALIDRLISLGFEIDFQYYSVIMFLGGNMYPGSLVSDLIVSWKTPDSISQVGDRIMNKAEFDGSIASMKKAVRIAWDTCEHPCDFVACLDEILTAESLNNDSDALASLRKRIHSFMEEWYS